MAKKRLASTDRLLLRCMLPLVAALSLLAVRARADDASFLQRLDAVERLARLAKVLSEADFTPAALGPMTVKVRRSGTVESVHTSSLYCEIDARTEDSWFATNIVWIVDDETMVKQGDTLAILDCSYVSALLKHQKAVVARLEEAVRWTDINDGRARDECLFRVRQAERDFELAAGALRQDPSGAILQSKAAQKKSSLDEAKLWASLHIEHTAAFQKRGQARLDQARVRLRHLEGQVSRCVIRAPHDGLVMYPFQPGKGKGKGRWAPPKVRHAPGEKVTEGQLLLRVCDLSKLSLALLVPEEQVGYLSRGQKAHVHIEQDAFPRRSVPALVKSVSEFPSKGNFRGDGRSFAVKLELQGDITGLRPEMKGSASITIDDCLRVPAQSVVTIGDNTCCFVLTDNGLEERVVETGLTQADFVAIDKGLEKGERVVKNPRDVILRLEGKK